MARKKVEEEVINDVAETEMAATADEISVANETVKKKTVKKGTTARARKVSKESETSINRFCNGLFVYLPESEFTQNEKYSDRYLNSKKR